MPTLSAGYAKPTLKQLVDVEQVLHNYRNGLMTEGELLSELVCQTRSIGFLAEHASAFLDFEGKRSFPRNFMELAAW